MLSSDSATLVGRLFMLRAPQFVFLSAFVGTFAALYALTSYVGTYLRSKGWDVRDIILIGLEKKDFSSEPPPKMWSASDVVNVVKADRSAQAAVIAGVLTVFFLLSKAFKASKYSLRVRTRCTLLTRASRWQRRSRF